MLQPNLIPPERSAVTITAESAAPPPSLPKSGSTDTSQHHVAFLLQQLCTGFQPPHTGKDPSYPRQPSNKSTSSKVPNRQDRAQGVQGSMQGLGEELVPSAPWKQQHPCMGFLILICLGYFEMLINSENHCSPLAAS